MHAAPSSSWMFVKAATAVFCAALISFEPISCWAAKQAAPAASRPTQHFADAPTASLLHGQVDYIAYQLNGAGLQIESKRLPTIITQVRMGSPAYFAGVCAQDKLLSCAVQQDRIEITISRNGKMYGVQLRTAAPSPDKAPTAVTPGARKSQSASKLTDSETKVLKDSNFAILVDASGSMGNNVDSSGKSRWKWCSENISDFADVAESIAGRRIMLVPFNDKFDIRRNCNSESIRALFEQEVARGGTNIATPLEAVVNEYLASKSPEPLIVAVITDGEPTVGPDVSQTIKDLTQRLSGPKQVKLVFFCIAADYGAERLMTHLDLDLYREGAKYDIVSSYKFGELQRMGLAKALLQSK
jgi:hypothetical protein